MSPPNTVTTGESMIEPSYLHLFYMIIRPGKCLLGRPSPQDAWEFLTASDLLPDYAKSGSFPSQLVAETAVSEHRGGPYSTNPSWP